MSSGDIAAEVGARSPRRVLDDLVQLAHALVANGRPRPEVELYLASGQLVKGRVVEVTDDRSGPVVAIQVGGQPRQPTMTFVRVDHVVAVTVADASVLVRAQVADAPPPSRLELQRQIAARSDALATKLGSNAPAIALSGELEDDGRRALGALLPVLFDVLAAIAGDEMGRAALVGITNVELIASGQAEAWKDKDKLTVRAPKLLTEAWTFASLRAAIEKQL